MIKILVVDDEAIHREGIIQIINRNRPNHVILEARNGQDALSIAESESLDLIITDVRMPRMDGLKFVELIRKLNHKTRIIILSGYRNFDYAQKALALGASEYLVKPIRESDVLKVLDKIEEAILIERQKEQANARMVKMLDDSLPIYFDKLMNRWITEQASSDELKEISDLFSLEQEGVILAVQFNNPIRRTDASQPGNTLIPQQQLKFEIKKHLDSAGHSLSFFSTKDDHLMITVLLGDMQNPSTQHKLVENLNHYVEFVHQKIGLLTVAGIGDVCKDVLYDAVKALNQAQNALYIHFYYPERLVIPSSEAADLLGHVCPDLSRYEEPLRSAIRQNASDQVSVLVDQLFTNLIQNRLPPPELLVKNIIRLGLNSANTVNNFMDAQNYDSLLSKIESRLTACADLPQLKEEFTAIVVDLSEWLTNLKKNKHDLIMKMCLQYLESHIKDDLTLKMVSDHFYFSPSYFSMIFRDTTGMTFNKYVSKMRLKKAAELLNKGCYRIYEVAVRVGYKDEKYFYRVFKKEFGVTPDDYRRIQN